MLLFLPHFFDPILLTKHDKSDMLLFPSDVEKKLLLFAVFQRDIKVLLLKIGCAS